MSQANGTAILAIAILMWVYFANFVKLTNKDLKYASSGDAFHALRQTRKIVKNAKLFVAEAKNKKFSK